MAAFLDNKFKHEKAIVDSDSDSDCDLVIDEDAFNQDDEDFKLTLTNDNKEVTSKCFVPTSYSKEKSISENGKLTNLVFDHDTEIPIDLRIDQNKLKDEYDDGTYMPKSILQNCNYPCNQSSNKPKTSKLKTSLKDNKPSLSSYRIKSLNSEICNPIYRCKICEETFRYNVALICHLNVSHDIQFGLQAVDNEKKLDEMIGDGCKIITETKIRKLDRLSIKTNPKSQQCLAKQNNNLKIKTEKEDTLCLLQTNNKELSKREKPQKRVLKAKCKINKIPVVDKQKELREWKKPCPVEKKINSRVKSTKLTGVKNNQLQNCAENEVISMPKTRNKVKFTDSIKNSKNLICAPELENKDQIIQKTEIDNATKRKKKTEQNKNSTCVSEMNNRDNTIVSEIDNNNKFPKQIDISPFILHTDFTLNISKLAETDVSKSIYEASVFSEIEIKIPKMNRISGYNIDNDDDDDDDNDNVDIYDGVSVSVKLCDLYDSHIVNNVVIRRICIKCKKVFGRNVTSKGLIKHTKMCYKIFRFACQFCNMKFQWELKLKKHLYKIHNQTQVFLCRLCSKMFVNNYSLNRHRIRCKGIKNAS